MNLLPSRPLRLDTNLLKKNQRKSLPLFIIAIVMACGLFAFAADLGKELLKEHDLWTHGVTGKVTQISGQTTTYRKIIIWDYSYDLQVAYIDKQGKKHDGKAHFTYMFSELNKNAPVELRYDPKAPDNFALNWQAEGGWPRRGMFTFIAVIGLCMLSVVPLTLRKGRQANALLKKVALDGEELWVEVLNLADVNGVLFITYMSPETDMKKSTKKSQSLSAPPLIINRDEKDFAIVLRSPRERNQLYFVPNDLGPFIFSADEKLKTAQMLASCRGN